MLIWERKGADGHLVPTGEYYVNAEIEWIDRGKDTSYQRIGFVNFNYPG